jgi:PAS domain S-box-containing protein
MHVPGTSDTQRSDILKIVLIYAVFAGLWILLSDQIAEWVFTDAATLQIAQTLKGWLFVGISSLLLYFLLNQSTHRFNRNGMPSRYNGLVNWKPWQQYLFALTTTLLILPIRENMAISFGERPLLILFMFPIILSAAIGGLGPGIFSTFIAALGVTYFAIPPIGSFRIEHSYDLFQLGFLIADGLLVSYLSEMLHEARYRSKQEQQKAETSLLEKTRALQLLDSIADGSTDAIFAKDLQGRYLLFNRAAARFVGKTEQETLGKDDTELFPQADAEVVIKGDRNVMAADQTMTYEDVVRTTTGRTTFLSTKGPLHDDNGKVVGLFGIARDISGIKATEEALRRERDRNQRYLDTVQTIMLALDAEGRITMINHYGCELLGYREGELLGVHWFKTCMPQPEGMEKAFPKFRQIMAGNLKDAEYIEFPVLCRDDSQRLIAWHNGYFTNEAGNIVGMLSSGEDLTERNKAEESLRESEMTYRSLFDNMMNSVVHARIIFNGDKPVDYEYLSTNPAFASITGITKPVVGRRISEIIPGYCENNPESLEIFGRVAMTAIPERWEHYLRELDRWFSFIIYSPAKGEVVILTDNITERKKAEISLREAEARYRSLFENNMDGVLLTIPNGGILAANAESQRIFGYSEAELFSIDWQKLIDMTNPRLETPQSHHGESRRFRGELTLVDKNGVKFPGEVSSVLFTNEQGQEMSVMIVHDISARKASEAALFQQTEEVRQRNEELERFNRATVGREQDMISLKQQINELSHQLGKKPPYPLNFIDPPTEPPKSTTP